MIHLVLLGTLSVVPRKIESDSIFLGFTKKPSLRYKEGKQILALVNIKFLVVPTTVTLPRRLTAVTAGWRRVRSSYHPVDVFWWDHPVDARSETQIISGQTTTFRIYTSQARHHRLNHKTESFKPFSPYPPFNPFSAGTDFRRQNLTSIDVTSWRAKSTHSLKE